MENNSLPRRYSNRKTFGVLIFAVVVIVIFLSTLSPRNFVPGTIILIEKGESIKSVSKDLKDKHIIKSKTLFNLYIQLSKKSTIASGEYLFEQKSNVFSVAKRIKNADYDLPTTLVTLTEGMTNKEMAETLSAKFPKVSKEEFSQRTNSLEGYLFPDTYKFNSNVTVDEVVRSLRENFEKKIHAAGDLIKNSKYSIEQIIIMASIVEAESTADGRTEVANILWKRFDMNMPLQVDAPFVYTIGKGTADLTTDDLKSDSLYNTYTRIGLTPTAIGNPGLDSIIAAANPQPTQNLYFLTGRDGKMYYAKSFEGHKQNRALYLD